MEYTIHKLAKLAGVSVRTLHHYDEIGLLPPSRIGENGYRYYGHREALQLQQILFFKELRFSLDAIGRIMTSPHYSVAEILAGQETLLTLEKKRIDSLLVTIKTNREGMRLGVPMNDENLYDGLSREQIDEYSKEAEQRWGNTEAYKQSMERAKHWTEADKIRMKHDQQAALDALVAVMDKGFDSPEVQEQVKKNHAFINEMFYDCSVEMFRNLGTMYVEDARFAEYYNKRHPNLAEFYSKAIHFYCDHQVIA